MLLIFVSVNVKQKIKSMKTILKTTLTVLIASMAFISFGKEKKAQTFTVTRTIKAPAQKVWAVVGEDFGAIANSHPKIASSNYINGTLKSGEGAERVCNFDEEGSKYVHEKQIHYDPQNYTFTAQIFHAYKLPLGPENNFAVYTVVPIDENTSKLVLDLSIATDPAIMGKLFKGRFKRTIEDYAIAVEHHVLTGENVNSENFKHIKKQYK
jgi:hypothetical protein